MPLRAKKDTGLPIWLITFTDVISLLLTFFVMLFAMSSVKQDEFNATSSILRGAFGHHAGQDGLEGAEAQEEGSLETIEPQDLGLRASYVTSILRKNLRSEIEAGTVMVIDQPEATQITIPLNTVFGPAAEVPLPTAQDKLQEVAKALSNIDNGVDVIVYTTPESLSTQMAPTSWELCLGRAQTIADRLYAQGYRYDIVARCLHSSTQGPLDIPKSSARPRDFDHRIDILIREDRNP